LALVHPRLVSPSVSVAKPYVTLAATDGSPIGKMSWQADQSAEQLFFSAAPALATLILVALAALTAALVGLRRLFLDLVDGEAALVVSRSEAKDANLAKT